MAKRLRRKLSPLSQKDHTYYCRKCEKLKTEMDFYKAVDLWLDSNGRMSVCIKCISEMYVAIYSVEHSMDRAIYRLCKALNVKYDNAAINAVIAQFKTHDKLDDDGTAFGVYKTKILSKKHAPKGEGISDSEDLTFQENVSMPSRIMGEDGEFVGFAGVAEFWGTDFDTEDYRYLEKELADWKRSFSCQNKAEEFFIREICIRQLEIEKTRIQGKPVDSLLKGMQELLKNAALTPAQQTASSSGKGVETWGMFVRNIEETTPAEFYKDKKLFEDYDDISSYIKKYITRPLKNFIMGSRDFSIIGDSNEIEDFLVEEGGENNDREAEQTI